MLDSILFKNSGNHDQVIDIGALAESLIFYGKVRVLGDAGVVQYLVRKIPPIILVELIESERIEFYYVHDTLGVRTQKTYLGEIHDLVKFTLADTSYEDRAIQVFRQAARSPQARLAGYKFGKVINKFEHDGFNQESVIQALAGSSSTESSVKTMILNLAPEYRNIEGLSFKINLKHSSTFSIDTSIDFANVNRSYNSRVPSSHSTLTPAFIVGQLQSAYTTAFYGAAFNSEVSTGALEAALGLHALDGVLNRRSAGARNVSQFIELTLENTYAIREAVNSGRVTFYEVLTLLEAADKFRHWVASVPDDKDLKRAYYQEVVKGSKFEKLPIKTSRWACFTAAGLGIDLLGAGGIGTLASMAMGAADTFLLDRLVAGWKPNHFVEGDFKRLFSDAVICRQ
ncbi:hypothetical protein AO066_03700 [Pseudomonas fluorescens]|nr:hypothetical protein AO066_03700 [Pseudomonas fluorescens]RMP72922.1 hypothetical protein ALQ17_03141 [Pseudomonas fluorescens]